MQLQDALQKEQIESKQAVMKLNQIIENLNANIRTPYPLFITDSFEDQLKGEVIAFEHYLNQELKANHLTIQQEAPLFNDLQTSVEVRRS